MEVFPTLWSPKKTNLYLERRLLELLEDILERGEKKREKNGERARKGKRERGESFKQKKAKISLWFLLMNPYIVIFILRIRKDPFFSFFFFSFSNFCWWNNLLIFFFFFYLWSGKKNKTKSICHLYFIFFFLNGRFFFRSSVHQKDGLIFP